MFGHEDIPIPRSIDRHIVRHRRIDSNTGEEQVSEQRRESAEDFDGAMETIETVDVAVGSCGHELRHGAPAARCESCSRNANHPVYVCLACAVQDRITGESLCIRCTELGPDGRRYSQKGLRIAEKMGLFRQPVSSPTPVCAPSRRPGLLARFMEWW